MFYAFLVTITIQLFLLVGSRKYGVKYLVLNPTQLTLGIFYIYCYLGVSLYWHGVYIHNHYDYSMYMNSAYYVLTVMIVSFYLGQICNLVFLDPSWKRVLRVKVQKLDELVKENASYLLTLVAFIIIATFLLSVMFSESFRFVHLIRNYIRMCFDSLIVISLFLFAVEARLRWFVLASYILISLYLGFRFRLVILLMAFIIYKVSILKRMTGKTFLEFTLWVTIGLGIIAMLGVARVYNHAPNLSVLGVSSVYETIVRGIFNDTSTILVLGSFVQYMDSINQFAGFNQLLYILSATLPSDIFPNKIYSPILEFIVQSTPNPQATRGSGAAVPLVGEFYHTAGTLGVVGFSFFFGFVLNNFFINSLFKKNVTSIVSLISYAVIMSWFLNSLTRGYFAQNTMDFFTIILGLTLIKIILTFVKSDLKLNY